LDTKTINPDFGFVEECRNTAADGIGIRRTNAMTSSPKAYFVRNVLAELEWVQVFNALTNILLNIGIDTIRSQVKFRTRNRS
jgi:hypothetical protein